MVEHSPKILTSGKKSYHCHHSSREHIYKLRISSRGDLILYTR